MGKDVADFWANVSLGFLGSARAPVGTCVRLAACHANKEAKWLNARRRRYDMSRTHSIMRIATTASPVSGAEAQPPP